LILIQAVCGISDCFPLVFKEYEQSFMLISDQRRVERHRWSIASESGQDLPTSRAPAGSARLSEKGIGLRYSGLLARP
jgi:hypothetical protein